MQIDKQIETESKEFFPEIVRDLPEDPFTAKFLLFAKDLTSTGWGEESIDTYLDECGKREVIPFSRVKVDYDSTDGEIVMREYSHRIPSFLSQGEHYKANRSKRNRVNSMIITGKGHPDIVDLTLYLGPFGEKAEKGLEKLREALLDELLETHEVINGNIVLNYVYNSMDEPGEKRVELLCNHLRGVHMTFLRK